MIDLIVDMSEFSVVFPFLAALIFLCIAAVKRFNPGVEMILISSLAIIWAVVQYLSSQAAISGNNNMVYYRIQLPLELTIVVFVFTSWMQFSNINIRTALAIGLGVLCYLIDYRITSPGSVPYPTLIIHLFTIMYLSIKTIPAVTKKQHLGLGITYRDYKYIVVMGCLFYSANNFIYFIFFEIYPAAFLMIWNLTGIVLKILFTWAILWKTKLALTTELKTT